MSSNDKTTTPSLNPQAGSYDLEAELASIEESQSVEISKKTARDWYRNDRVWQTTDEETYYHFLGCVPPLAIEADRFLCGEPYTESATTGSPVCLAFKKVNDSYFAMLMSHREFAAREKFSLVDDLEMKGLFEGAQVISCYTRAQAITDGVLVEVTELAKEAGFKVPCVVTLALYSAIQQIPESLEGIQDFTGRLWDVLSVARFAATSSKGIETSQIEFTVEMPTDDDGKMHKLLAEIHPGDQGEPVLTIGYPSDF